MAKLNAPGRTLIINGRPATVRFTVNRLIAVEERFGGLEEAGAAMANDPLKAGRFLLWLGTGRLAETEEEFGDMEIEPGLAFAVELVSQAFSEAVGATGEAAVDPTQPETALTPGPSS